MENTESNDLLVDIEEGVMQIKLNRPQNLNAFSPEMIFALKEAIKKADKDNEIRVITISGSGRAFCAGGDVKRMGKRSPIGTYDHIGNLNELILSIQNLEKPIIAVVHGYAAGAGFNLALACDIILTTDDSKFVLSFSKVGLISDGGGLYFLPRLIGIHRAKELFFNAESITAKEAHSLGIVNHIYPAEDFEKEVGKFVSKIAAGPSKAFGFIKKISNQSLYSSLEEILEQERITQATVVTTEDHAEGILAFKEKRNPEFGRK